MIGIGVGVRLEHVRQMPVDWDAKALRFTRQIAAAIAETTRFIVNTKLRLPGLAVNPSYQGHHETRRRKANAKAEVNAQAKGTKAKVRKRQGGKSGPTPGSREEPVLHRDTGDLAGSINTTWPSKPKPLLPMEFEAVIGQEAWIIYGRIHELGGRSGPKHKTWTPPRPYMQPGADLLEIQVKHLVTLEFERPGSQAPPPDLGDFGAWNGGGI